MINVTIILMHVLHSCRYNQLGGAIIQESIHSIIMLKRLILLNWRKRTKKQG